MAAEEIPKYETSIHQFTWNMLGDMNTRLLIKWDGSKDGVIGKVHVLKTPLMNCGGYVASVALNVHFCVCV